MSVIQIRPAAPAAAPVTAVVLPRPAVTSRTWWHAVPAPVMILLRDSLDPPSGAGSHFILPLPTTLMNSYQPGAAGPFLGRDPVPGLVPRSAGMNVASQPGTDKMGLGKEAPAGLSQLATCISAGRGLRVGYMRAAA